MMAEYEKEGWLLRHRSHLVLPNVNNTKLIYIGSTLKKIVKHNMFRGRILNIMSYSGI